MEIRSATEHDLPSIVNLLKISLGESLMPKSETFWRWKHMSNPFGESPVLLAFDHGVLIGVRAFMKWEWKQGDKVLRSVRAVDTATHPDHQGKGIFKKLTLSLVDQSKNDQVDFIFNTPNKNSKPGYLKMGWVSMGKLKVDLLPLVNFRKAVKDFESRYSVRNVVTAAVLETLRYQSSLQYLKTNLSPAYINWRYVNCPNVQYFALYESRSHSSLAIFRLKTHRWGVEFRICDVFFGAEAISTSFKDRLLAVARESGARLISFPQSINSISSLFPSLPIGPEITVRQLQTEENFLSFDFWKPSLGDMEVF